MFSLQFMHFHVQLCLTLTVSKLNVNSHYGQYVQRTGEMC